MSYTPAPWVAERDPCNFDTLSCIRAGDGALCIEVGGKAGRDEQEANTRLAAAAPDLLPALQNAAATIGAVYQWLDMVKAAGSATSISGIAKCHAMLKSLENNRDRTERFIMAPARAAIAKATA